MRFWNTKEMNQIQLVSTDISDIEDPISPVSSIGLMDKRLSYDFSKLVQQWLSWNSTRNEKGCISELGALRVEVQDMCEDLIPDLFTQDLTPFMDSELSKIEHLEIL